MLRCMVGTFPGGARLLGRRGGEARCRGDGRCRGHLGGVGVGLIGRS